MDALQGVDLEIQPGELVALLGPNGAGKTTSVSIRPNLPSARRPVGVTLQESGFLDNLTVAEVVDLVRVHWPDPAPTGDLLDRSAWSPVGLARGLVGRQLATNCTTPVIKAKVATAISSHFLLTVRHHPLH